MPWVHFAAVFTGRKHRHVEQKPSDTDFMVIQSRNRAYKNSAKIIQNSRWDQGRSDHRPPPEYAIGDYYCC